MSVKWIEGFRPGTHIDTAGIKHVFTAAQCIELAETYNPALHEAPIVIGHPKGDDPAMGWVGSMRFNEQAQRVEYVEKDLLPEFTEMLGKKMFKKRSLALYTPNDPVNPTPGKYHLRHVGYLGAMPPAIKGLADRPAFNEASASPGITFEFSEFMDWDMMNIAGTFRRLREFFIEKFGKETADNVIPDWQVTDLTTSAAKEDKCAAGENCTDPNCCYHEHPSTKEDQMKPEEVKVLIDDALKGQAAQFAEQLKPIAALTAELAGLRKQLADGEDASSRREFTEFCTGLSTRILPAEIPTLVDQLMNLRQAAAVEFGEGDQKTTISAVDDYKARLKGRAETIRFGEFATGERAGQRPGTVNSTEFGEHVDEGRLKLHSDVIAFQEANAGTSYEDALAAVQTAKKGGK